VAALVGAEVLDEGAGAAVPLATLLNIAPTALTNDNFLVG
jgi:hypothetical protein